MTTFEGRYKERLREFEAMRDASDRVCDAEVEYILSSLPFIRAYTERTTGHAPRAPRKGGIDEFVEVTNRSSKNLVFQNYLVHVEKSNHTCWPAKDTWASEPVEDVWTCLECQAPLEVMYRESITVCPSCGLTKPYMENSLRNVTYDQEVQQYTSPHNFAYKRLNHFTEWLNSLQAKENTDIPQEVLDAVRAEFKKARTTTRGELRADKVRLYLKKLKLNKYYEHTYTICNMLRGVPAPQLPPSLEDKLKRMFGKIQEPFMKHKPATRKNFLSYSYVLYKFCELLGEDSYLQHFPLLRSSEKLYLQDKMWKDICKELGWEFIRSI